MERQLGAVALMDSNQGTQKHNNSTIPADMDTKSKNMTGKSSYTKAISNLEEIEEEVWSKSSTVDTSVTPRLRMKTRDSAYESTEDINILEGKYMFRNEVNDKKNVLNQDRINKDEELQSLSEDNETLKEKCRSLELNLKVVEMQLKMHMRANDTIGNYEVELGRDKELLQNEKEALTKERNKLYEDLEIMKRDLVNKESELEIKTNEYCTLSAELQIKNSENYCLSMDIEKANQENELFNKKIELLLIEKQQLIEHQELGKKDAERLVIEKEQELTKELKSIEPLLEEAVEYNEQLKSSVESLEKEIKEKENSILILQDRNYLTEVRLSKTRRYIKHREREFNEEFDWINVDFRNKMHNMNQERNRVEQIGRMIGDKYNALIGINDVLKKNLSIAENKIKISRFSNDAINFVNNNAKMLAETLQKERESLKSSSSKIKKLEGENHFLKKAVLDEKKSVEGYKIKIQDLEKEKVELTVQNLVTVLILWRRTLWNLC